MGADGYALGSSHKIQLQNVVCSSRFEENHPHDHHKDTQRRESELGNSVLSERDEN